MATKEGIALIIGDLRREEIKEGIDNSLEQLVACSRMYPNMNMMPKIVEWRQVILQKLHSQGIVLEVDRELPEECNYISCYIRREDGSVIEYDENSKEEKHIYVAVEPLINKP